MTLPAFLEDIRRHTGMYVMPTTFDGVLNYLSGYDAATHGGLLVGFREWLIVRWGDGKNLAWVGLVHGLLAKQGTPSDDKLRIEDLFVLLEDFYRDRDGSHGLGRIYGNYERWLRAHGLFRDEFEGSGAERPTKRTKPPPKKPAAKRTKK